MIVSAWHLVLTAIYCVRNTRPFLMSFCFNGIHKNLPGELTFQMEGYAPRNRNQTNQFLQDDKKNMNSKCVCMCLCYFTSIDHKKCLINLMMCCDWSVINVCMFFMSIYHKMYLINLMICYEWSVINRNIKPNPGRIAQTLVEYAEVQLLFLKPRNSDTFCPDNYTLMPKIPLAQFL